MTCSLCPVHCTTDRPELLKSPYPELLYSSSAVPSDSQLTVIHEAILRAETKKSVVVRMIDRLKRQHEQLEVFLKNHQRVVSTIRRLPTEILSEIFGHYVNTLPFRPRINVPITQVCRRFREVALASPALWCHFWARTNKYDIRAVKLQLEWSGHMPLSIDLGPVVSGGMQGLLSASARRWQELTLELPAVPRHCLPSGEDLPSLKRLSVRIRTRQMSLLPDPNPSFIKSVPALEELTLFNNHGSLSSLYFALDWARLRVCTLNQCLLDDTLRILPLFSPGTSLTLEYCTRLGDSISPISSPISSLTVRCCSFDLVAQLLRALAVPALETLDLSDPFVAHETDTGGVIAEQTFDLLARSACPLSSLRIGGHFPEADLLRILGSPHASGLGTLDVARSVRFTSEGLAALVNRADPHPLANPTVVPHLRALSFYDSGHLTEAQVLAMVTSRRPVLQSLRLEGDHCKGLGRLLSPASLKMLRQDGMLVWTPCI
ncbi:hypothetical protein DFH07DRAFT_233086 [Mycena maculata]|uniref:F-box domain-containing protein n=1 Tax=Mycena maculata TaxID=230809 RepID=A0AAD7MR79_9AGAR|nr:hypothetical protein DFH07DRAFT_233086 [Mycena maculata]